MTTMIRFLLALLVAQQIAAFTPRTSTFTPASTVNGVRPPSAAVMKNSVIMRMSSSEEETKEVAEAAPVVSADGTFYDDEMDSAPIKQGISDSMKERLIREASTGLDSESKQTNVILYISIGVAVLVLLGGQGIFF